MARYIGGNLNAEPVLKAIDRWKTASLLSDNGIFEDREALWSTSYLQKLGSIVEQLDNKGFYSNFNTQLKKSGEPEIIQLAAEICWFVHLCPSNTAITQSRKRDRVKDIWKLSNAPFPENSKCLKDDGTLKGIGDPGTFFRTNQKKEWKFFIRFMIAFKTLPRQERVEYLKKDNCWEFAVWLEKISESGNPTLRHMVLFLLFPDNFDRIFSGKDKKEIVKKFTGKSADKMSMLEIDQHIFNIRQQKEKEYGNSQLDFYHNPLKKEWKYPESNPSSKYDPDSYEKDRPEVKKETEQTIKNVILYGPPGTGKTYRLNELTKKYSSKEQTSRKAWLMQELSEARWFDVIFGALYDLGENAKVNKISEHEYVRIKAESVGRDKHVKQTIWSVLQSHAPEDSETVKYRNRGKAPTVFDKNKTSVWSLVGDWKEECQEQVELANKCKAGPDQGSIHRRFEFVTFHQAYGYEDFVEGIRPVLDEETGTVKYEIVPGVFKRICLRAKADPDQRYAIFIDEINRGNIASIFGELITLLETDKRVIYGEDGSYESGMTLTLPYSEEQFGVPTNLDVYGTMNTADRSIALLDTALRRRFQFQELMPDSSVINGSSDGFIEDSTGGKIDLRALLKVINSRIRFLLSRDMTIGHSYLINVRNFDELKDALLSRIIPLLQEYFYDDWHRIQLVFRDVGPSREKIEPQIIRHKQLKEVEVIGFDHDDFEDSIEYWVTPGDEITPDAIRKIYEESN